MKEENLKNNNSLLSTIPKRLDLRGFYNRMKQTPFMPARLPESKSDRRQLIHRLAYDWFHVGSENYDLYERLHDIISQSYRVRDQVGPDKIIKVTVDWFKHLNDLNYVPPKLFTRPVEGMTLLGVSGTGKSTCIEAILEKCFPKIIQRDFTTQIVHLKINCPSIGSVKSLCQSFFFEVDRTIGTNYVDQFKNPRYTSDNLIITIANVAARHLLGVLIIDEIHHLNAAKGYNKEQVLNFFKNLNTIVGVPIVYIGTPEAAPVLFGNFQQARRAQGIGSVIWDRFNEDDSKWTRVIDEMWKYQVLRKPGVLTEELKHTYYNLSQGIFDVLVKLHICAQKRALTNNLESIDCGLLEVVAKDELNFISPMLNALRTNDPSLLSVYRDVSTRIIEVGKRIEEMGSNDSVVKRISNLLENEFSYSDAKMIIEFFRQKYPGLKEEDIIKSSAVVSNELKETERRNQKKKNTKIKGLLPRAFNASKSKKELITKLNDQGIVKPISEVVQLQKKKSPDR